MCVFERSRDLSRAYGALKPAVVVFPDGEDARAVAAACRLHEEGLARPVLLGNPLAVRRLLGEAGRGGALQVLDPAHPLFLSRNVADLLAVYKAQGKPAVVEDVQQQARCPLAAGALMVRRKEAALGIAGNISSTADVLRAGLRILGRAPGVETVSSFFFMIAPDGESLLVFTDAAVVPEPTPLQLADIAIGAADHLFRLMGEEPRVAMLSFSTKGSALHPRVQVVRDAVEEVKRRAPGLLVDGELQFDAAMVPEVAAVKAPESALRGRANILVFPSLEAGNISYKVAQRLCGYTALGPFMQGFAHGWHDLSRGCTADDMYKIAVVALGMECARLVASPPHWGATLENSAGAVRG